MSSSTAYLISVAIVGGIGALLYTLRYLKVKYLYFFWTAVAHLVFVTVLSLAVFSEPLPPSRVRLETIQVVMLPSLPEKEKEESVPLPPSKIIPQQLPPSKLSPELPHWTSTTSMASRLLGVPTSLPPSSIASSRTNLSPVGTSTGGLPPLRSSDLGEAGGVQPDGRPSSFPRHLEESSSGWHEPFLSRQRGSSDSSGRVPSAPHGQTTGSSVALPRGFSLVGEVKGRALRWVPDPPTTTGTTNAEVAIRFWVSPDGRVERVQLIRKAGDPSLERVAQEWVQRLLFAPLPPNVESASQWGEITVAFRKEFQ